VPQSEEWLNHILGHTEHHISVCVPQTDNKTNKPNLNAIPRHCPNPDLSTKKYFVVCVGLGGLEEGSGPSF